MTRWQAAGIHLGISAVVAGVLLGVMLFVWYPPPFFTAVGGSVLLCIMIVVDVVLGPSITCIIFDLTRKSLGALRFDLAVIGMLQILALSYGASVMYLARPVYVVFVKDRFEVVTATEIDPAELVKGASEEFRRLPMDGPRVIAARPPSEGAERDRILFASVFGQLDWQNFPQLYEPYAMSTKAVLVKALTLPAARETEPAVAAVIDRFLARAGRAEEDVRYVPVRARRAWLAAVIDAKSAEVMAFLAVDR